VGGDGPATRTDKADQIRLESEARAQSKLGYENIYDVFIAPSGSAKDYIALSNQIARLAAVIRAMGERAEQSASSGILNLGLPARDVSDLGAVYGPSGPTAKSVRLILEYRLMVSGNPRLRVGPVSETDSQVRADVVTTDGSLVERYAVDKKTGAWSPIP
jgi:hypothetical protein